MGSPEVTFAPVAVDVEMTTKWAYLQDRYDVDLDGRITSADYTRGARTIDG
jgi:hypothetical protein